ncbi:MAG: response regulator [Myxococcales bacterium]|nr:response regulator [Myxococcales bacterium]
MSGAKAGGSEPTHILVVEDDKELAVLIQRMLGTIGEVQMAANGQEALALLQKGKPRFNLVVTDVAMPQMDGFQLSRSMKNDPVLSTIPVIMLTARTGPGDLISGINAGARFYLTKPFRQSDLIAKAKKALGKK